MSPKSGVRGSSGHSSEIKTPFRVICQRRNKPPLLRYVSHLFALWVSGRTLVGHYGGHSRPLGIDSERTGTKLINEMYKRWLGSLSHLLLLLL
ncbi:hypothetical protein CEXT_251011 [Caerostris extrusa]|uniref:Uncharacterized protein n=1 Tax=Caerostris extrusa TaxID=172846 RepID=A0AAV4M477_CAEEX|nr:hypothetical protein CEXT_251011 [Caerostris extrusa]